MPAPAVALQSTPAQMRRTAWALVMGRLRELDGGQPDAEALLSGQVDSCEGLAALTVALLDLTAAVWAESYPTLAEARAQAAMVALEMASQS